MMHDVYINGLSYRNNPAIDKRFFSLNLLAVFDARDYAEYTITVVRI